jgi:hypothetical protein
MADDSNAKPPPSEIVVEATEWPHFLRHPSDSCERVRRAHEQCEHERELVNKQRTHARAAHARQAKPPKRQRKVEIVIKIAETVIPKKTAWQVGGVVAKHKQALELGVTQDAAYRIVRRPEVWSRLTSLFKR